jgi:hypothetical protein
LSNGRHLPSKPVARVIIRHLVIRPIAFKNAFNTFSATLIAFNNFEHSTNDALDFNT